MRFDSLKAIALLLALAVFIGCSKKQTGGREDDGKSGLARGGQGEGGDDQKKEPADGGRRDRGREPEVVHVAAPQARAGGGGSVAGWVSSEKLILTAAQAKYVNLSSVRISPDGHRVAVYVNTPYSLVLDGKAVVPPKDLFVSRDTCAFSGDSKHFAYIASAKSAGGTLEKPRVILDDKPVLVTRDVPPGSGAWWWHDGLALNHDGSAVVSVVANTYYTRRLTINDQLINVDRSWIKVKEALPEMRGGYSYDYSTTFALSLRNKPRWARSTTAGEISVDDGEPFPGYGFTFSRDGSTYGYFAATGPVVAGKQFRRYPNMSSLVLSHDGKHFAHLIADKLAQRTKYYVSVDGKALLLGTTTSSLRLSADAKRWAADGGEYVLTGDFDSPGKVYKIGRSPPPATDAKVVLSEDHRHLAYRSWRYTQRQEREIQKLPNTMAFLMRDGKKEVEHAHLLGDPVLSRDGSRYAYVAVPKEGDDPVVYIDGKAGPKHDNVRLLGFTPEGTLIYLAKEDFAWRLVIEGKSRTVYDSLVSLNDDTGGGGHVHLNPDGSVTYLAVRDGAWYLVTERKKN